MLIRKQRDIWGASHDVPTWFLRDLVVCRTEARTVLLFHRGPRRGGDRLGDLEDRGLRKKKRCFFLFHLGSGRWRLGVCWQKTVVLSLRSNK